MTKIYLFYTLTYNPPSEPSLKIHYQDVTSCERPKTWYASLLRWTFECTSSLGIFMRAFLHSPVEQKSKLIIFRLCILKISTDKKKNFETPPPIVHSPFTKESSIKVFAFSDKTELSSLHRPRVSHHKFSTFFKIHEGLLVQVILAKLINVHLLLKCTTYRYL